MRFLRGERQLLDRQEEPDGEGQRREDAGRAGTQQPLHPPDRVPRFDLPEAVLRFGEHGGDEPIDRFTRRGPTAVARRLGEEEAPLVEVCPQLRPLVDDAGDRVAAGVQHGAEREVLDGGPRRVDPLPRHRQVPRDLGGVHQPRRVAAVRPPSRGERRVRRAELRHDDRPPALREEQQRERRRDRGVSLRGVRAAPRVGERFLSVNEELGPFAVPIVLVDEPPRAEPAGPFQRVQVVVVPRVGHTSPNRVAADREVPPEPRQRAFDGLVFLLWLATADRSVVADACVRRLDRERRDDQRPDPGARHAAAGAVGGVVAPRAVVVLPFAPVGRRPPPDGRVNRHARLLRRVEPEQRELRVAGVGSGRGVAVAPSPFEVARLGLRFFEPPGVAFDQQAIAPRRRFREDHRLQRDNVSVLRRPLA